MNREMRPRIGYLVAVRIGFDLVSDVDMAVVVDKILDVKVVVEAADLVVGVLAP